MKKPNHSNDSSGQNYDPETGKYIKDSDSKPSTPEEDAFGGEDPGWDEIFSELALPPQGLMEDMEKLAKDKANQEFIAKDSMSLGTKQESACKLYGELYDLDPQRVAKATDGEIDELIGAIHMKEKADEASALSDKVSKLSEEIKDSTWGVWKSFPYGIAPEDFPSVEHSLQAKIDWLAENKGPESAGKLNGLAQKVADYGEAKAKLASIGEGKNGWSETIGKFQNPASMYSQSRKDKAIWCKSVGESEKRFGAWENKCFASMTLDEAQAVIAYTGSGYSSINKPLNSSYHKSAYGYGKDHLVNYIFGRMKLMTSALDKCRSEEDIWVQRGVGSDMNFGGMLIGDLLADPEKAVGQTFVNHAFMSCGAAKGTGFGGSVIMNIYCPKGTSMAYVGKEHSNYAGGHENEMIINRGYAFIVRKVEKKNGQSYVDLDLVAGSNHYRLSDEQALDKYKKNLE